LLVAVARHAHSTLNLERRVNGDPAMDVPLTEQGGEEAARLGAQFSGIELDLCICTRFPRTQETARAALAGRDVPIEIEPLLDDVKIGDLEGATLEEYRVVKKRVGRKERFPGGESLDEAARRYAGGYRRVLERGASRVLVICHEIPLRYALNAAAGSDELDGPPFHELPNAVPYLFDADVLSRAVARIEQLAA
jgi:broad specificity phosphatase PhoE